MKEKKKKPKQTGFEYLDHTADLGVRAWAPTLPELFARTAEGMLAAVADTGRIEEKERVRFETKAHDVEELLVSFLRELIYQQAVRGLVFRRVEIRQPEAGRLEVEAFGEKMDPGRHWLKTEIKAVTYHGLRVEKKRDGWLAEVIFDV